MVFPWREIEESGSVILQNRYNDLTFKGFLEPFRKLEKV
jgi:hypothetical protein